MSIMTNIVLVFLLFGAAAFMVMGSGGLLTEEVVRKGPASDKIAMITIQGIIHGQAAGDVYRQLEAARQDRRIRGLIVHVNSPGGTISASDQIYEEIRRFRADHNMPVVAFMQGVAASGGYYVSVACEEIIAEPTTITGSIGVISSYFVLQGLLEEKLGVVPVTITSGKKKDWPSSFSPSTPEQRKYLEDKLVVPALKRFTDVVVEGRTGSLTRAEIDAIAEEAEIYGAQEALKENLIDKIGYLDDAVSRVKSMAGISDAQVVRYRKPFSFSDFLMSRQTSLPKLDKTTLYELGTPEVLYLWGAY
jgi:protease-4